MRKSLYGALFAVLMVPAAAMAQQEEAEEAEEAAEKAKKAAEEAEQAAEEAEEAAEEAEEAEAVEGETGVDVEGAPLPQPKSDTDEPPPVAAPGVPDTLLVRQAGIGGQVGYGRAGVLELGGAAGFTVSEDFTQVSITPSIGWFVADNLQVSALVRFTYVSTEMDDASLTTALVEPSYHLPFSRTSFGFLGFGLGVAHVSGGEGFGFALAPRLGANFLIGRSGILTPALSWQYTTHDTMETGQGAVAAVSSAVTANIGYTIMW